MFKILNGIIGYLSQGEKIEINLLIMNYLQLDAGFKPASSLGCDKYPMIPILNIHGLKPVILKGAKIKKHKKSRIFVVRKFGIIHVFYVFY